MRLGVADVAGDDRTPATRVVHEGRGVLGVGVGRAVADHDVEARRRERDRDPAAESLGGSRDDGDRHATTPRSRVPSTLVLGHGRTVRGPDFCRMSIETRPRYQRLSAK